MTSEASIYGERLADLLPRLMKMGEGLRIAPDGYYTFGATFEPGEAAPLLRALLSVESELLLEEADELGDVGETGRTHEERSADAFIRLFETIAAR